MDNRDMAAKAEKYKQEMMKLYGKSTVHPENPQDHEAETVPAVNVFPEENKPPVVAEEEQENEIKTEVQTDEPEKMEDRFEERYPEPDLSELTSDFGQNQPEEPVKKQGEYIEDPPYSGTGYIVVNVRAGDQADPIENAIVHVASVYDGNRFYNATGVTDNSGTTVRFTVPAPSASYSQAPDPKARPYALYDISVTARGFFNARSVDVPVFEGITSVQSFSMIPLPLYMKSTEETVTYFNQEPNL